MKFGGDLTSKSPTLQKEMRKVIIFGVLLVVILTFVWLTADRALRDYKEREDSAVPADNTTPNEQKTLPPGETQTDPQPPEDETGPVPPEKDPALADKTHGMFRDVKDYEGLKQDTAYNYVLRKVHQMSQAEIQLAMNRNINIKAGKLLAKPDEYRGDFFRARGTIVYLETLKLNTNPVGVEDVYEAYLVDIGRDDTQGYYVHVIERPTMPEVGVDQARVDGVFFKILRYETRNGEAKFVPFIFGKRLVVEKAPKMERTTLTIEYVIVGILAAAFFTVLIVSFVTRRGDAELMHGLGKLRRSRAAQKGKTDGLSASGPDKGGDKSTPPQSMTEPKRDESNQPPPGT
ncbi:MAG: hypothetical protein RDV41_08290 [Planctomycetota bacterium]|nr:hypothetical protein [Planctomycetota bacterium]